MTKLVRESLNETENTKIEYDNYKSIRQLVLSANENPSFTQWYEDLEYSEKEIYEIINKRIKYLENDIKKYDENNAPKKVKDDAKYFLRYWKNMKLDADKYFSKKETNKTQGYNKAIKIFNDNGYDINSEHWKSFISAFGKNCEYLEVFAICVFWLIGRSSIIKNYNDALSYIKIRYDKAKALNIVFPEIPTNLNGLNSYDNFISIISERIEYKEKGADRAREYEIKRFLNVLRNMYGGYFLYKIIMSDPRYNNATVIEVQIPKDQYIENRIKDEYKDEYRKETWKSKKELFFYTGKGWENPWIEDSDSDKDIIPEIQKLTKYHQEKPQYNDENKIEAMETYSNRDMIQYYYRIYNSYTDLYKAGYLYNDKEERKEADRFKKTIDDLEKYMKIRFGVERAISIISRAKDKFNNIIND